MDPLASVERQLEAVRDITVRMAHGASAQELLELIVSHAVDLVGADIATIALPADDRELVMRAAHGVHSDEILGTRFPVDRSISGEVIRKAGPIQVEDVGSDDRAFQPIVQVGGFGPSLFVPLSFEDETFGTLLVSRVQGGEPFDPDDLEILEMFASQAGLVFVHERQRRTLREISVFEERDRLAEDLGGTVIHELFGIGLELERITGRLDGECEHLRASLVQIVDRLDRAIRHMREAVFNDLEDPPPAG